MELRPIAPQFTETADQEVVALMDDLALIPLAAYLHKNKAVPEKLLNLVVALSQKVINLFSADLPDLDRNPERALRQVSREINLARLLRERGLFRLYRLVNQVVFLDPATGKDVSHIPNWEGTVQQVPVFMTIRNPDTEAPFASQDEFIGWFCQAASVSRSLVFSRIKTIESALSLGFNLNDVFHLVLSKPYAITETLNLVGFWKDGELQSLKPGVAVAIAKKYSPAIAEHMQELEDQAHENPEALALLNEAAKPLIANLLTEVAHHDEAKEAIKFVRYDVLKRAEVVYAWDDRTDSLVVELVRKGYDDEKGEEHIIEVIRVPFVPDVIALPKEVREDLVRRLPIRNKFNLDK